MHLSTSNFERVIPASPWRGITVSVVMMLTRRDRGLGDLLPLARLRAQPERYRRSLGRSAPSRRARVARHRGRFARPFRLRPRRTRERAWASARCNSRSRAARAFPVLADLINDTTLSRHHHLQRCPATVFRAAGFAADESCRKNRCADLTPRRCPTRESRSRDLSREMVRLHEAGRPDARRAS